MMKKRSLSIVIVIMLIIGCLAPFAAAPAKAEAATVSFMDISNHWARLYILNAVYYNIISGYGDNTFKPDNPVSRVEFITMVNNTFGNVLAYDVDYTDTAKNQWYYNEVCKAVTAGIVSGYEDKTFRPNNYITRQEAAVMLSRLLPGTVKTTSMSRFPDGGSVASWAKEPMERVVGEGYMGVYDDGRLHPSDRLTRAQAVKILCTLKEQLDIEEDDLMITAGGITYKNKIFSNSVTVSEKVGDESVTFQNCVMLGPLSIKGGGDHSVVLDNTSVAYVEIDKKASPVRLVSKNGTKVGTVDAYKSVIIETDQTPAIFADYGYGYGFDKINVQAGAVVTLDGHFKDIYVKGANTSVQLTGGEILYLDVPAGAGDASVTLDKGTRLSICAVSDKAAFHGLGNITKMYAYTNQITYETYPDTVLLGEGVRVNPTKVNAEVAIAVSPANNEADVALKGSVTISFNQSVTRKGGRALTESYIRDAISFTSKKATGTPVDYTLTRNSDDTVFTLTPTEAYAKKTKYYITIEKEVFEGETEGMYNKKLQVVFTTGDGSLGGVTFKPENDSAGSKANIKPTITFANEVEAYDGESEITAAYLKKNLFFYEYDEDAKNNVGDSVRFTAEINKKMKVITITPTTALEDGTVYCFGFNDKAFRQQKTYNSIAGQTCTFTVGYTTPTVTFDPKSGTKIDVNETFEIEFSEPVYDSSLKDLTETYIKTGLTITDRTAGTGVTYDVAKIRTDEDSTYLLIKPTGNLTENHSYEVAIADAKFMNKNKKAAAAASATYTVPLKTPEVSGLSASGKSGEINVEFSSNMAGTAYVKYTTSNDALSESQVKSGATTAKVAAGKNYVTVKNTDIKGGEAYTVYVVIVSGSITSNIANSRVTPGFADAYVNEVRITGLEEVSGSGVTSLVAEAVTDTITFVINTSETAVRAGTLLEFEAPSDTTVLFDSGTSFKSSGQNGRISYFEFDPSKFDKGKTLEFKVKAVCSGKNDKAYTIKIKVE